MHKLTKAFLYDMIIQGDKMKNPLLQDKQIISLRIDKETLDKIDREAEKEERDRSKQIIYMLKKYFEIKEKLNP